MFASIELETPLWPISCGSFVLEKHIDLDFVFYENGVLTIQSTDETLPGDYDGRVSLIYRFNGTELHEDPEPSFTTYIDIKLLPCSV